MYWQELHALCTAFQSNHPSTFHVCFSLKCHYMENGCIFLPFKVAQEAESISFLEGYRSAWFRCKIKKISCKKGALGHCLEYFDYPDEKSRWVKLYQKPPYSNQGSCEHTKMELMVRPRYPPFYRESELPNLLPISDVIVIGYDIWKVGDLVDWWCDGCFWSGRVTQILGNDKVQIKLPDPPIGEGCFYEALCKDLRPSLEWSPENGWMIPMSGEFGNGWYCAHLKRLHEQDGQRNSLGVVNKKDDEVIEVTSNWVSESSISHDEVSDELGAIGRLPKRHGQYSFDLVENPNAAARKYPISARNSFTLESSIMNLEELTCKIKWLKGLLKFGFQWSDLMKPSWKFMESHEIHSQR